MRLWPVALLPAMAVGWYIGTLIVDMTAGAPVMPPKSQATAPGAPAQKAPATGVVWDFHPGRHAGFTITSNGAKYEQGDKAGVLRGDNTAAGYQLISSPIQVVPGKGFRVQWKARMTSGSMAIGVMDAVKGVWIDAITIGNQDIDARFTAPGDRVLIIIVNSGIPDQMPVAELGPARVTLE